MLAVGNGEEEGKNEWNRRGIISEIDMNGWNSVGFVRVGKGKGKFEGKKTESQMDEFHGRLHMRSRNENSDYTRINSHKHAPTQHPTRASQSSLDLIADQQNVPLFAELRHTREIRIIRNNNACLSLLVATQKM